MKNFGLLAAAIAAVDAFPAVMQDVGAPRMAKRDYAQPGCTVSSLCDTYIDISDAQANIPATDGPLQQASKARNNCGALHACKNFDAASQYVSNKGAHKFIKPGVNDIRGPCPGLNAAANHAYLPRNGIANIQQTIDGLGALYSMSAGLAGFLAIYSIVFDGDLTTGTWSIGGPLPPSLLSGLLGTPQGDGYSHNNYEGDTSITRCDSYINGGDAHSVSLTRFKTAWESYDETRHYTMDTMGRLFAKNTHRSIMQNPYYFSAAIFSTTLVAPAAHNFIIAFMSNRTAENPGGYLTPEHLQTWWGVSGDYPNFTWDKGQERIPDNWYKRPQGEAYDIPDVFGDLLPDFLAYPDTFRFGGNTNGVNTYGGVDIANLTGGVFNLANLFEGDNFACFVTQGLQQVIPLQLQDGINDVAKGVSALLDVLGPLGKSLQCPELSQFDSSLTTPYTGHSYKPLAPQSGPKNC